MGGTQERRWNFWYWLGVAFAAYLLPFIAYSWKNIPSSIFLVYYLSMWFD